MTAAQRAQESGNPSAALELFILCLAEHSDDHLARYGAALAAARLGSISQAKELLEPLLLLNQVDHKFRVDCHSLLGRLQKDRYERESGATEKAAAALQSANAYLAAYELADDYYPGLNAATMLILANQEAQGHQLAEHVMERCERLADAAVTPDPWLAATLGELCLLQGKLQQACDWYAKAKQLMGNSTGNIASMRRQLRLISERVTVPVEVFDILSIPAVVSVTGNMIDQLDATKPRFPPTIEPLVKRWLENQLAELNAGVAYCSAACGVDILFAEIMLERGAEVHIYLPFAKEDFADSSIRISNSEENELWSARFAAVLEAATSICYATKENYLGDELLFAYNADVITGQTIIRAQQLEVEPVFIAVYDFDSPPRTGGARATAESWQQHKLQVQSCNLADLRQSYEAIAVATDAAAARGATKNNTNTQRHQSKTPERNVNTPGRDIRAMIFADAVGFSGLREAETPLFALAMLNTVAELIDQHADGLEFKNTWGDGFFFVFESLPHAADFALRLREAVAQTDWLKSGLPNEIDIRIALHVGPVFPAYDPVLEAMNFFGSHVNQTARIEPVTAPGSIFVSDQAAALLTMQAAGAAQPPFACDYLGTMALPKNAGSIGLHRLRRHNQIE